MCYVLPYVFHQPIARGLPPLNEDAELSEEEEKARREAAGIKTTVPARPDKKKKGG